MILKGKNSIDLNQSTMIQAIEDYLNSNLIKKNIKVTKVSKGGMADHFNVDTTEVETCTDRHGNKTVTEATGEP